MYNGTNNQDLLYLLHMAHVMNTIPANKTGSQIITRMYFLCYNITLLVNILLMIFGKFSLRHLNVI